MPPEPPVTSPRQRLRRLPGRSPSLRLSRATATARLWMDDGQLIQETVRSYTQEVQRFAFADLQAVQIRRTARGLVYNIILTALLALMSLSLVGALNERAPFTDHLGLSIICGFLVLLLLINIARGPTCHTVLLTALGPQRLFSLSRMRQARRALDTLIAGVNAVQGALRPDEAARLVDQAQTQQTPFTGSPPAARPDATLPGYHY